MTVPVTGLQRSLWYLNQAYPGVPMYWIPTVMRVSGRADLDGIRAALAHLARTHEALGIRFATRGADLVAHPGTPAEPEWADLRSAPDPQDAWDSLLERAFRTPVDLSAETGFKAIVAVLSDQVVMIALFLHHICGDARSVEILIEDFAVSYESWTGTGAIAPPDPARPSYQEVAVQVAAEHAAAREASLAYWRGELADVHPLVLPGDRPRPAERTFQASHLEAGFPAGLRDRVDEACRDLGATRFTVLAAALGVALARWSGDEGEPVLAVPLTLRRDPRHDDVVAPLLTVAPLRVPLLAHGTFRDLVTQTLARCVDGIDHAGLSLEEVASASGVAGGAAGLSSVSFQVAPPGAGQRQAADVSIEWRAPAAVTGDMDLVWDIVGDGADMRLSVTYAAEVFGAATVRRMAAEYLRLVEVLVSAPDTPLRAADPRDAVQRARDWERGATPPGGRENPDLATAFTRAVAAGADRPAIIHGTRQWTYGHLSAAADAITGALRDRGVSRGGLIAVAAPRGPEYIAALVAGVRAGLACAPLDIDGPAERNQTVLRGLRPEVIVTVGACESIVGSWAPWLPVIAADCLDHPVAASPVPPADPDAICSVLATSGTTGRPKAVVVTRRALATLVRNAGAAVTADDVMLQLAPLSFDVSAFEVWSALGAGATLVLPETPRPTAAEIGRLIRDRGVTVAHVTAGLLRVLAEAGPGCLSGLRSLLTGGDVVPVEPVRDLMLANPRLRVIACYGPTENGVFSSTQVLSAPPTGPIPLGRALPGRGLHVLDERMLPVLPGAVGEIYVDGVGLSHGYLGDPRQTALRFVAHPAGVGARLYRTGDLARLRGDGSVEFLGRGDEQVKIRGHRVEPAEVEAVLSRHPAVSRCLVRARGKAGERTLAAYLVVAEAGSRFSLADLRAHAMSQLPEALVPTQWAVMDALPLTARGKVDLRALDTTAATTLGPADGRPPATPAEAAVHEVWCSHLNHARISMDAGFYEAGGHSLAALRIAGALERLFGCPVPLAEMLRRPTIASQAKWLSATESATSAPRPPQPRVPAPLLFDPDDLADATAEELAALRRLAPDSPRQKVAGR